MTRPQLVIVLGPTASGKSALAVRLAKKYSGEIVSVDSRQVYRHLDIGTGKITKKEMRGIKHYCIDIANPKKIFTVDQFRKEAEKALTKIYQKGKIPILAGGTGFYIDAVLYGASYPEIPPDWRLRRGLEKRTAEALFKILKTVDSKRAGVIDPYNKRRLIRAIEVIKKTGWIPVTNRVPRFNALIIGIKTDPSPLRKRISQRLKIWLRQGLIREVKTIHEKHGVPWKRFDELGFDYRYIARFLQGTMTQEQAVQKTERELWHYARRQMTYFKKMPNINWISTPQEAENLVENFLQN